MDGRKNVDCKRSFGIILEKYLLEECGGNRGKQGQKEEEEEYGVPKPGNAHSQSRGSSHLLRGKLNRRIEMQWKQRGDVLPTPLRASLSKRQSHRMFV